MKPIHAIKALAAATLIIQGCSDGGTRDAKNASTRTMTAEPRSTPTMRAATGDAGTGDVRLSRPADETSIGTALDLLQGTSEAATATREQSFDIIMGGKRIGTLVTGEAVPGEVTAEDEAERICFVSVVAQGRASLVSTVGTGRWRAQACTGTRAVAARTRGEDVAVIMLIGGSTGTTDAIEPVVVRWTPSTHDMSIDERWTERASIRGATTIEEVERAEAEPRDPEPRNAA